MSFEFQIDDLIEILKECPEYRPAHHLGRPFMSAYQIAIRFAERFPNHFAVQELDIGGSGVGVHESLTQQIARFLSQAIRQDTTLPIQGGFISHQHVSQFSFNVANQHQPVEVSTLHTEHGHSIFRFVG